MFPTSQLFSYWHLHISRGVSTRWCSPIISWFIIVFDYRYIYHNSSWNWSYVDQLRVHELGHHRLPPWRETSGGFWQPRPRRQRMWTWPSWLLHRIWSRWGATADGWQVPKGSVFVCNSSVNGSWRCWSLIRSWWMGKIQLLLLVLFHQGRNICFPAEFSE